MEVTRRRTNPDSRAWGRRSIFVKPGTIGSQWQDIDGCGRHECRLRCHQLTTLLKQVAPAVCGLGFILDSVGEGPFRRLHGEKRFFSAAQSLNVEQKP
jgi:hypothetical protein